MQGEDLHSARHASLRVLRLAMVGCLLLPLFLAVSGTLAIRHATWRAADERLLRITEVLHEQALKTFQSADVVLQTLTDMTDGEPAERMAADAAHLHDLLVAIAHGLPQVQSIWIFDAEGVLVASSDPGPLPTLNVRDRAFFTLQQQTGQQQTGQQQTGQQQTGQQQTGRGNTITAVMQPKLAGGQPFFALSARRRGPGGSFGGVISVSLRPADFENFYRELDLRSGSLLAMFLDDGSRLVRFPPLPSRAEAVAPIATEIAGGGEDGIRTRRSLADGVERRSAWRRVDPYPVVVLAALSTASIRDEWLNTLGAYLIVGAPATILMLAALWLALGRTRALFAEGERRAVAENAVQHAQRLEALGELTGGVAHDFNNLLMIVLGSADRLRRRPRDAADIRALDMIAAAVRRGETLTRQLLSFARRRALFPEPVDLGVALADMKALLDHSLRGDVTLVVESTAPEADCVVRVDPSELELAILNVTVNARDAMPKGGRLAFRLRRVVLGAEFPVEDLCGDFVALSMADDGAGMAPDVLRRAFEPFFTTKSIGKGSGLGLSQVYGFARQSDGAASIASAPGEGTTVTLYLPHCAERPRSRAANANLTATPGNGLAALLVEDNAEVAAVTRVALEMLGFTVSVAASAAAALSLLQATTYALVVTDILMPGGMSGVDLVATLREQGVNVPVIVVSGHGEAAMEAARGGSVVLRKPFDEERLRGAVAAVLAGTAAGVGGN